MHRDEAKHILELCRPGNHEDRQDPLIAEALGMLETDAELRAWFEAQQTLDARIADVYNEFAPPSDLKASILAGMRAHAVHSRREEETGAIFPGPHNEKDRPTASRAWWRNPWIGIAAVFAVLLALSGVTQQRSAQTPQPGGATINAGVPDMIQFLAREINHLGSRGGFDKASDEPEALRAYLTRVGSPSPSKLPRQLENNPSLGCFSFDYEGVPIGMICFKQEQVVHLITVRKSDCPQSFRPEQPTFYEVDDQAFKAWTDEDLVYILSTKGGKEKLPKMI
ncbi:MAG: hypothetical protein ACLFU4_08610 [Opitutales bacterium]